MGDKVQRRGDTGDWEVQKVTTDDLGVQQVEVRGWVSRLGEDRVEETATVDVGNTLRPESQSTPTTPAAIPPPNPPDTPDAQQNACPSPEAIAGKLVGIDAGLDVDDDLERDLYAAPGDETEATVAPGAPDFADKLPSLPKGPLLQTLQHHGFPDGVFDLPPFAALLGGKGPEFINQSASAHVWTILAGVWWMEQMQIVPDA